MKAERITNKEFSPIEIKITIESQKELEAMTTLFGYTTAHERAKFINENIKDSNFELFTAKEVLFMERISDVLLHNYIKGSYEEL